MLVLGPRADGKDRDGGQQTDQPQPEKSRKKSRTCRRGAPHEPVPRTARGSHKCAGLQGRPVSAKDEAELASDRCQPAPRLEPNGGLRHRDLLGRIVRAVGSKVIRQPGQRRMIDQRAFERLQQYVDIEWLANHVPAMRRQQNSFVGPQ